MMKSHLSIEAQLKYKYIVNLDGWGWPTNFIWSLASNSVSLKNEPGIVDWYYCAFQPHKHYIPIQKDLSDLLDVVKWAQAHDDQCPQMALDASQIFRNEVTGDHALLYLHLVLNTYAKHQRFNTRDLLEKTQNDSRWIRFH